MRFPKEHRPSAWESPLYRLLPSGRTRIGTGRSPILGYGEKSLRTGIIMVGGIPENRLKTTQVTTNSTRAPKGNMTASTSQDSVEIGWLQENMTTFGLAFWFSNQQ